MSPVAQRTAHQAGCANCIEHEVECVFPDVNLIKAAKAEELPTGYLDAVEHRYSLLERMFSDIRPDIDLSRYLGPPLVRDQFRLPDYLRGITERARWVPKPRNVGRREADPSAGSSSTAHPTSIGTFSEDSFRPSFNSHHGISLPAATDLGCEGEQAQEYDTGRDSMEFPEGYRYHGPDCQSKDGVVVA
jgi:hypothetical protein